MQRISEELTLYSFLASRRSDELSKFGNRATKVTYQLLHDWQKVQVTLGVPEVSPILLLLGIVV